MKKKHEFEKKQGEVYESDWMLGREGKTIEL